MTKDINVHWDDGRKVWVDEKRDKILPPLPERDLPWAIYHGTSTENLDKICTDGLQPPCEHGVCNWSGIARQNLTYFTSDRLEAIERWWPHYDERGVCKIHPEIVLDEVEGERCHFIEDPELGFENWGDDDDVKNIGFTCPVPSKLLECRSVKKIEGNRDWEYEWVEDEAYC